jgi:hypothetical protein
METKTKPTSKIKKNKYFKCMEEDFNILHMSISPELLFHVEYFTTPNEVWTTLEGLFGK